MYNMHMNTQLAEKIRNAEHLTLSDKIKLIKDLSIPGILAVITETVMGFIDTAMVGALGALASASIGLVMSSTWLFGELINSVAIGFSVQVAHAVGAGKLERSKRIFKGSILTSLFISFLIAGVCYAWAHVAPTWLQAQPEIWKDATNYLGLYAIFLPIRQLNYLVNSMLQCAGDMKTPSKMAVLMCILDIIFNFFLIFPSRMISLFGLEIWVYGANLGVLGAQLGTSLAVCICTVISFKIALTKSNELRIKEISGNWFTSKEVLSSAWRIGMPNALAQSVLCMGQIASTKIIAPLGTVAIAAHSFGNTVESICYMPGYGIAAAATTLIGQAIGAGKKDLAKDFANIITLLGMAIMGILAIILFFTSPMIFAILTPDVDVQQLGVHVIRVVMLVEPLFAASIVITGVLRGAGDTVIPFILNLLSLWGIRITLAFFLAPIMGLMGAWLAMTIDIAIRGVLYLIRLYKTNWLSGVGG